MPPAELIGKLLNPMLGRAVTVNKVPYAQLDLSEPATVGVYERDTGMIAAACLCDLELSAYLGAALVLAPQGSAEDAIDAGALPEILLDGHREIVNVASRLFNRMNRPHVKLRELFTTPCHLPRDVANLLNGPAERLQVEVDVDGYGTGVLQLVVG
jgi:hypothetical protein